MSENTSAPHSTAASGQNRLPFFYGWLLAAIMGGAAGPWIAGVVHDLTGSYAAAFWISIGGNLLSATAIWRAAPGKVRAVAGRIPRAAYDSSSS